MPIEKTVNNEIIDAPVMTPLDITKIPVEVFEKYQLVDNTLKLTVKPDVADEILLEIGDSKQPEVFMPQFKVSRWSNEVNFSLRHIDNEPGVPVIEYDGEKVMYKKPKIEVHQYDKPEAGEDGGYEFEWVLNEPPATNVLQASIKTKGLEFYYQPALTEQEITEGANRPENVVGSYAVYHSTKRDNIVGGKEYKTGKAFHIYRPEAIDAEGNRTWCEINIDTTTELATVTVPQEFLDKAVYPVLVDPTFGYTSQGASDLQICTSGGDNEAAQKGTSISGGLTSISAYVKRNSANSNTKLEIWSDTGTVPSTRLDGSANIAVTSATYSLKTASVSESLSGNYWVLAQGVYGGAGTQVYIAYDTGSGTGATSDDVGVWTADSNRYSVYALVGIDTANYTNCHAITIDNTKVSGAGDLTDFPILISGTYDGTGSEPDLRVTGSGGQVTSSSGYDIEFSSDSAGATKLAHEIEKYVSTTGEIYAWVKVPTLDGDANTVIYMWFGNSAVTASTELATSVWDSNFKYVEHFNEASGTLTDSTTAGTTVTNVNSPTYQAAGISGGYGMDFEADSTQYLTRGANNSFIDLSAATEMTAEFWTKIESTATNRLILYQGRYGYFFIRNDGTNFLVYTVHSSGTAKSISTGTVSTATWYHMVVTWKKNDYLRLYVDGTEVGTAQATLDEFLKDETGANTGTIGAFYYNSASQYWDGIIDEIRLSNTKRSTDWIITTYNTIGSPSTFYSVSTTNLVGGGGGGSTWVPQIIIL